MPAITRSRKRVRWLSQLTAKPLPSPRKNMDDNADISYRGRVRHSENLNRTRPLFCCAKKTFQKKRRWVVAQRRFPYAASGTRFGFSILVSTPWSMFGTRASSTITTDWWHCGQGTENVLSGVGEKRSGRLFRHSFHVSAASNTNTHWQIWHRACLPTSPWSMIFIFIPFPRRGCAE